ncbi:MULTISPECIES: hypothetical protein [Rubrivivax]|uniref:Uncharacterized protein n=1 Tax=Rubrivivax benzoatilyticus TaxID=316997 RepID=A0ABX0HUP2_9BURK|nr:MULTISPECIES: hypothetical protein [Rubrivivax]MCD0418166.1 hypothetical protein [Rubrivivax sp. JA1024]EGJ11992.1 hypothetical protein RBXJA2T_16757 [Rubrivivax benzoatilyticus JA2 = ATCC BAA-35]MCC9595913.1 hypothetical protein [Rubrivivax sp. JA1055]MCC9647746.1 hypothetical protein [Rubrivivax sp. JA1029]NHK97512.1 hypothetical protein [Rubrivivax benzoatilyticus]
MNAETQGSGSSLELVDVIDLKWLFANEGVFLHVERLQHDADYARGLLDRAAASANPELRAAAARLNGQIEAGDPAAA